MNDCVDQRITRSIQKKCLQSVSTTISCPNFFEDSALSLHQFYQKEKFCDVTVTNGRCNIQAHRVILAAHSQFYKSITEKSECKIFNTPNSISKKILESLLSYMYTGSLVINNPREAILLFDAASCLEITSATMLIKSYLAGYGIIKPDDNILADQEGLGSGMVAIKIEEDELLNDFFTADKSSNSVLRYSERKTCQKLNAYNQFKKPSNKVDSKRTILNHWVKHGHSFVCETCPKSFKFSASLKFHKASIHNVSFTPSHVKRSLKLLKRAWFLHYKLNLLQENLSESQRMSYWCLKCSQVFNSRSLCIYHISLHFRNMNCFFLKNCKTRPTTTETHCKLTLHSKGSKMPMQDPFNVKAVDKLLGLRCSCCDDRNTYNEKMMVEHMTNNHPHVVHSCQHCPFKTRLEHIFKRHHEVQHKTRQICQVCGKSCAHLNMHMLLIHQIQDSKITKKLHRCTEPGCGYVCLYKKRVEEHALRHEDTKRYKCDMCEKMFKHQKGLNRHKLVIHDGVRPYICDICGQAYGQEGELKVHIMRHNSGKTHVCHLCTYSTQYKANLESHLFKIHQVISNEKMLVFSCDQCPYITNRRSRFNDHVKKKHKNIVDIPCTKCNKMFSTRQNLYGHMTTVHRPKTFQCGYCTYSTGVSTTLKQHIKIMHTHRDIKNYECTLCGFRSATSGNCRKHIQRLHMNSQVTPKYVGLPSQPVP